MHFELLKMRCNGSCSHAFPSGVQYPEHFLFRRIDRECLTVGEANGECEMWGSGDEAVSIENCRGPSTWLRASSARIAPTNNVGNISVHLVEEGKILKPELLRTFLVRGAAGGFSKYTDTELGKLLKK